MRAGRRSTTSCSARCSTPAARRRSRRPSASAAASSTSASAPASRCPTIRRSNRIVGVDYSEPMLRKAHERVIEHKLAHVEALAVMDAQQLGFPDAFFDAVVAQYVITTVPDPEAALDEFARVTAAGRRDHPGQSSRRRGRAAPRLRAGLRAAGAPARLAAGISPGRGWRNGPSATAACAWSSAGRCRRSGISR